MTSPRFPRAAGTSAALVLLACAAGSVVAHANSARTATMSAKHRCVPTAFRVGALPRWAKPAWANSSSPGGNVRYLLASNGAAAAFGADILRAGHPTNPANKVLWIVRSPRNGKPLTITARWGADPATVVRIRRPANSSPGEIYPSYVDLPKPGCWELTLTWGPHTADLDVAVHPRPPNG